MKSKEKSKIEPAQKTLEENRQNNLITLNKHDMCCSMARQCHMKEVKECAHPSKDNKQL